MGRPRTIGDVQPFALLSEGARTRVYKGYQPTLDRFVLLKVLQEGGHDEALSRRFQEEARLVARVQHPNVVAVHACGRDGEQLYLVAEFVEGRDLHDVLGEGPLPPDLAAFVTREAARGLQAAHARDVLHRDLKPANLLLSTDGRVKVADFGMASLRGPGKGAFEIRGTPAYLAPEQVLGEPPAPSVDVFALGATLYEMLAARPAFTGSSTDAVLDAVLHHDPMGVLDLHADVPAPLRRVCERLLEKDTADRYPDAAAVAGDLERVRRTLGFTAGQDALAAYLKAPEAYHPSPARAPAPEDAPETPPPEAKQPGRRRAPVLLAVLGVLLLAGLGYAGVVQWRTPESSAPPTAASNEPTIYPGTTEETTRDTGVGERSGENEAASIEPPPTDPARRSEAALTSSGEAEVEQPDGAPSDVATHSRASSSRPGKREQPDERMASPGAEEPATGRLRVMSVPWAVVYVDGDSVGVTPMTAALTLPAGTHRLTLKHPRLPPYEGTVRIASGQMAERSVQLWKRVARLSIEVAPWAEVLINGAVRDTTPLTHPLALAPGTYTLTLRHPTFGAWKRRLHVRAGEERTVSVNLIKR